METRLRELSDALAAAERRASEAEAREAVCRGAIENLFAPGPGVATPEKYEPDYGEPHRVTWNAKIDALLLALAQPSPVAAALVELERAAGELMKLHEHPVPAFREAHKAELWAALKNALAALDRARGGR